jgi:hypothetical protein
MELYDGVRRAAFYFPEQVKADDAPAGPPTSKNALGKCGIRMHVGGLAGTGSQGCLVSPWYWSFRNVMTVLHERRHRTYYEEHPDADLIADVNLTNVDPPPIVEPFRTAAKYLDGLLEELQRLDMLVREASQQAEAVGGDGLVTVIEQLTRIVGDTKSRMTVNEEHGDSVEPDRVADLLDDLSLLFESEPAMSIDGLRSRALQNRLASIVRLNAEIASARAVMDAKNERVGWTHALQSDLYIIRPHERSIG